MYTIVSRYVYLGSLSSTYLTAPHVHTPYMWPCHILRIFVQTMWPCGILRMCIQKAQPSPGQPTQHSSLHMCIHTLRGGKVSLYRPTGHRSFPKGGKAPPPPGVSPAPPSGAAAHMVCPIRARSALENPLAHCPTKPVCVPTDHNHA